MLDCCYSGNFKGGDPGLALAGRGRWVLSSSRSGMLSAAATSNGQMSAFTELFVEALRAGSACDRDGDGFITVDDVHAYVSPRLKASSGQVAQCRWDGSGVVPISRAPKAAAPPTPIPSEHQDAAFVHGEVVAVPPLPAQADRVQRSPADDSAMVKHRSLVLPADEDDIRNELEGLLIEGKVLPVRQALKNLTGRAAKAIESGDEVELTRVLDSAVCVYATAQELDHPKVARLALDCFVRMYELGFDANGLRRTQQTVATQPQVLWLRIVVRVLALGGEQVREGRWEAARELATQRPRGHDFRFYNNWIRHGLTEAYRANLFASAAEATGVEPSLITLAAQVVASHDCLDGDDSGGANDATTQLCQFDFLWCYLALQEARAIDRSMVYPSFSRYYSSRTDPIVEKLVADPVLRKKVVTVDDDLVANLLRGLGSMAQAEGARYGGWRGYSSGSVEEFFSRHPDSLTH